MGSQLIAAGNALTANNELQDCLRRVAFAGTRMEMHQVRYFLAVARQLNFTRAAEECHVAQPSLTRAIKQLEEEFGGELFRRERNLTHLSELGQRMLPLMRQCYDSAQAAKQVASSIKKGALAPLCIALPITVSIELTLPFLKELVRAMPGLNLKFVRGTCAEVSEQLKKGSADLAVAAKLPETWDRLEVLAIVHGDLPSSRRSNPSLQRPEFDPASGATRGAAHLPPLLRGLRPRQCVSLGPGDRCPVRP